MPVKTRPIVISSLKNSLKLEGYPSLRDMRANEDNIELLSNVLIDKLINWSDLLYHVIVKVEEKRVKTDITEKTARDIILPFDVIFGDNAINGATVALKN